MTNVTNRIHQPIRQPQYRTHRQTLTAMQKNIGEAPTTTRGRSTLFQFPRTVLYSKRMGHKAAVLKHQVQYGVVVAHFTVAVQCFDRDSWWGWPLGRTLQEDVVGANGFWCVI